MRHEFWEVLQNSIEKFLKFLRDFELFWKKNVKAMEIVCDSKRVKNEHMKRLLVFLLNE